MSTRLKLFVFKQLSFTLVSAKVDEQCVFRHRGERKVKTVEEDVEDVTSRAAELLDEGEELIGTAAEARCLSLCTVYAMTTIR